ncbi:MAG: GNAT family N-acetyltransferase [Ruminiclostridium sp.]|nr:GNAT family N-acetyltransferase [Ruminiclostridium sp.]
MTDYEIFRDVLSQLSVTEEQFRHITDIDNCTVFREEDGVALIKENRIVFIGVAEKSRGKGIGKKLLSQCENHAKKQGFDRIGASGFIAGIPHTGLDFFKAMGYETGDTGVEMGMDISGFEPLLPDTDITYDFLSGRYEELKKAVAYVDEEWVQYFDKDSNVYCGFKNGEIACFCLVDFDAECILSDENSKVTSIGCVGTVPKFRRNGYGLKMVENATLISKEKGCNKGFIHQTHLESWYGKLGYKTVIKFSPVRKIF